MANVPAKSDAVNTIATLGFDTVAGVEIGKTKLMLGGAGIDNGLLDKGQQAAAGSLPVALASDQIAVDGGTVAAGRQGRLAIGSDGTNYRLLATDATGKLLIGGSVTATISGTVVVDSELPAAALLSDAAGNPTTPLIGSCLLAYNGTSWDRLRVDASKNLLVVVNAALPTGTNTIGAVDTELPSAALLSDAAGNPTTPLIGSCLLAYNGISWDRLRVDASKNLLIAINAALPTGSNTIGAVIQSGSWNVGITGSLPAGSNLIGSVSQGGSWIVDTELPAAATLADNTTNPTTPVIGSCMMGFDGTTWDRIYTIADGDLVAAGTKGFLCFGMDGSNYQAILTDTSGRVVTTINGTVTVTVSGAVDTELPAAAALSDATANPTVPGVGAFLELYNGASWDRVRGDTANGMDVDVTRMAALVTSTARIGRIEFNAPTTGQLSSASINASASGDNTLVSGVVGQTVRVHKLLLVCNGAVNIKFKDGTLTDLTPVMNMLANGSQMLDFDAEPWFTTSSGNGFVLNLSGAVQVSGRIYYSQS